ncbi:hypothetical protein TSAR_016729 [Trichomalopsis sarcophagae]|uniref:RHD domain-containing protein n=1 Tax=Trichomalopsis sarcophagae TaxID=543379 RepID=A0A232EZR4_9HYME|nr:hypothetical protein TSAR_016729 [Trichomalopsis sarcophagae]
MMSGRPYVKITEEPSDRECRFRYDSEARFVELLGVNASEGQKSYPTIQIMNYMGSFAVVVSCVTKDEPYMPHPYNLVGKSRGISHGICHFKIPPGQTIVSFNNIGIQRVRKRDMAKSLEERKRLRVDPFKTGYEPEDGVEKMDTTAVRLCFQVFLERNGKFNIPLDPVVSEPIFDHRKKPQVVWRSHFSVPASGGTVVCLLCEKVTIGDIQVCFFDKNCKWEAIAEFYPPKYHKQYALIFKTPRYVTQDIDRPVKVFLQLKRPSDGELSLPVPFLFLPKEYASEDGIRVKRRKFSETPRVLVSKQVSGIPEQNVNTNISSDACSAVNPEPATSVHAPNPEPATAQPSTSNAYMPTNLNYASYNQQPPTTLILNPVIQNYMLQYNVPVQYTMNPWMHNSINHVEAPQTKMNYPVLRYDAHQRYWLEFLRSDPYEEVAIRNNDNLLHKALKKIFRVRCQTRRSIQLRELVSSTGRREQNDLIAGLMRLEPAIRRIFPTEGQRLSLLWTAVLSCYQKSAELLVRSAANVNELLGFALSSLNNNTIVEGSSILNCVVMMYPSPWNDRFIVLLIEHGAEVNARDPYGWTALHTAVKKYRIRAARSLLERGANVHAIDVERYVTPLLTAALIVAPEKLVRLLIEFGASAADRNISGMNALHCLSVVRSAFPLHKVCILARIFIENGTSLHEQSASYRYQPLHGAVFTGKLALARLFLRHGANVNARVKWGEFPLYVAVMGHVRNHNAIMTALFESGADIDMITERGLSVLHAACMRRNTSAIWLLLEIDPDMLFLKDINGNTPFDLIGVLNRTNRSIYLMLRALALHTGLTLMPSAAWKDEMRIQEEPQLWDEYQACVAEIRRAKNQTLIGYWTFLDLLTKCNCQIAKPMRRKKFGRLFRRRVDLFPNYRATMTQIVNYIKRHYLRPILRIEQNIQDTFGRPLPALVSRKIAEYVVPCAKCTVKKMVAAARGSGGNNIIAPAEQ